MSVGTRARAAVGLRVIQLVAMLSAVIMVAGGAHSAWARREILVRWPAVVATVQRCDVHKDFPFQRNGGGISVWVQCKLTYNAAYGPEVGIARSIVQHGSVTNGAALILRNGRPTIWHPELALRGWVLQHRSGTQLQVRYDPSAPRSATFAGLGEPIDRDPFSGFVAGVFVFIGIALAARWGAQRLGDAM